MLDVKGAFNNLSWKSIFQALRNIGCPRNIFHLVRSYFKERRVVYSTPSSLQEHSFSMGCPQGSNSGPLYWILVENSLLEMDLGPHAKTSAYADDFVVLVTGPNAYVISRPKLCEKSKIGQSRTNSNSVLQKHWQYFTGNPTMAVGGGHHVPLQR